jgi:hypothetical protein
MTWACPHILGSPSSYLTLQPNPSEFPYILGENFFSNSVWITVCRQATYDFQVLGFIVFEYIRDLQKGIKVFLSQIRGQEGIDSSKKNGVQYLYRLAVSPRERKIALDGGEYWMANTIP